MSDTTRFIVRQDEHREADLALHANYVERLRKECNGKLIMIRQSSEVIGGVQHDVNEIAITDSSKENDFVGKGFVKQ